MIHKSHGSTDKLQRKGNGGTEKLCIFVNSEIHVILKIELKFTNFSSKITWRVILFSLKLFGE